MVPAGVHRLRVLSAWELDTVLIFPVSAVIENTWETLILQCVHRRANGTSNNEKHTMTLVPLFLVKLRVEWCVTDSRDQGAS